MRLQLTAIVTALMSGMMGFIGGFCFAGISAIPYIGPFASLAVGLIMTGAGIVSGGQEIQKLCEEGKYFIAAVKTIGIVIDIVSIVGALKSYCFEAGTLVETENGKKPIEEIEVGEYVYAKNLVTGEVELCKVVGTSEKESQFMVRIKAAEEDIYATANHCFYIEGKGWIEAGDIQVGDMLVLQDGAQVVALSIQYEVLETPIRVYNLTVEGLHNYYAGELGVLVHNTCEDNIPWSSGKVADAARQLENGSISVTVDNRSQVEELFLRLYQGNGYKNVTGMDAMDTKNLLGGKGNTYHWDDIMGSDGRVLGHGSNNADSLMAHLQIHPKVGNVIRIFFDLK